MATGVDANILAALCEHLAALALVPALPIAFPGVAFPEVGEDKPEIYLAVAFLPNQTRRITLGSDPQQKRGIFQVDVYWTAGVGLIKPLDVAGQIIDHFKNQTLFTSGIRITITGEPWAASPLSEDDRVKIPVTITYHAFEAET